MEDDNSMSERILQRITYIINNDPNLKDFTIIPTGENTSNKSPVLYMDHSIGLESWCVKYVYRQACADLFDVRRKLAKGKLPFDKMEKLNHLLIGVLLINPDVPTFWAMRKELVQCDIISADQELFFSKIVLSYKSKSNEAFSYRRWLLKRLLNKCVPNDLQRLYNLLLKELEVSELAANNSPNNYHCWNHRIWCIENLATTLTETEYNLNYIVNQELEFIAKWLQDHVSEHTGYHYRQFLIQLIKSNKQITFLNSYYFNNINMIMEIYRDPISTLEYLLGKSTKPLDELVRTMNFITILLYDLLVVVNSLNTYFVGHESLWYHRRWLLYELMRIIHEFHNLPFKLPKNINNMYIDSSNNIISDTLITDSITIEDSTESGEKLPKLLKFMPNRGQSDKKLYTIIIELEKNFLIHNREHHKTINNDNLIQMEYMRRHEQWLRLFLGFN